MINMKHEGKIIVPLKIVALSQHCSPSRHYRQLFMWAESHQNIGMPVIFLYFNVIGCAS